MKLDKRDVCLLLSLLAIIGGVACEFSAGWAAIAGGSILFMFGVFGRW